MVPFCSALFRIGTTLDLSMRTLGEMNNWPDVQKEGSAGQAKRIAPHTRRNSASPRHLHLLSPVETEANPGGGNAAFLPLTSQWPVISS